MAAAAAGSRGAPPGVLCRPPPGLSDDDEFVDYHLATVYYGDLLAVPAPAWWNDSLITFAFEYLQHSRFAKNFSGLRFVNAASSQLLQHENELSELRDALTGLGVLSEKHEVAAALTFFPVCDIGAVHQVGGSHWTLLIFDSRVKKFFAFDSLCDAKNLQVAPSGRRLAESLAPFLLPQEFGPTVAEVEADRCSRELSAEHLVACLGPKQMNQHDCGPFVVAQAEQVAALFVESPDVALGSEAHSRQLRAVLTKEDVQDWRRKINEYLMAVKLNEKQATDGGTADAGD